MSRAPTPSSRPVPFNKPWASCADQAKLLGTRGLVITDRAASEAFLDHVGYYRFSGYCLAFEQSRHHLRLGVSFEQVRAAYEFDQGLRDLIATALEAIEIDIRTAVAHQFGRFHGAFGHTDPRNFYHAFKHHEWAGKLRHEAKRSNELFVRHFKTAYSEFPDLPVWMVTGVMSFGSLSMMFQNMLKADQKAIGSRYGVQAVFLESWIHHLVYLRNICAHHARLWDRVWAIKPKLPPSKAGSPPELPGNERIFVTLLILNQLLKCCPAVDTFRGQWRASVAARLATPPSSQDPFNRMGLTRSWIDHPNWR